MKFKNAGGLLLHVLIVLACLAAFCGPFLGLPNVWLFLMFVGVTHYIQDWAKIKFTSRSKHGLFFFLLDQALHILFISALFLTDLQKIVAPPNDGTILLNAYINDTFVLYMMGMIITSYTAHFMITLIRKDYLKIDIKISLFEKRYGFIERILIFSALMVGQLWLLSVPAILALRLILFKLFKGQLGVSSRFASWPEIILSGTASILTGLIFNAFI